MSFSTILVREIPFGERLRRRFVAGPGSTPTPTPLALPQAAPAAVPPTAK